MSVLIATALLATLAAGFVSACLAYILFSFWRGERLLSARLGRKPPAVILMRAPPSRLRPSTARGRLRLQPVPVRAR